MPTIPDFVIAHELPGRLRLRADRPGKGTGAPLTGGAAAFLANRLAGMACVVATQIAPNTGSILIYFQATDENRRLILEESKSAFAFAADPGNLAALPPEPVEGSPGPEQTALPEQPHSGLGTLGNGLWEISRYLVFRALVPAPLRILMLTHRALPYFSKGLDALAKGRLNVDVLDAAAIGVSIARRDFRSATTVIMLLKLGDLLESWTRQKSHEDLARVLHLDIGQVWVKRDGQEFAMDGASIQPDDLLVVRAGSSIPVDGVIAEGEAMVNQASLTGEPLAIHRVPGDSVYAGTVIEEGEIIVRTLRAGSTTRLANILKVIEKSEKLKATIQGKMERLADAAVPLTLGLAALTFFLTRSATKATSVLLVDYSCAIRLATPLAILAAMRQGAADGVLIKGGRFLEVLSKADTVFFDKTGTLTKAEPAVRRILTAPGHDSREFLRIAACLEEHFPHPVARAVVNKAKSLGLDHREEHAKVEYIAAHGIASMLHGKRVLLGSRHFVHEDEGVPEAPARDLLKGGKARGYSLLHMAIGGELAGIIMIDDPLRPEAPEVVRGLKERGIRHLAMLTGDSSAAARKAAGETGIATVHAHLLPEDKQRIVQEHKDSGHLVVVVGDGLNDSWALSAADVGVSLHQSADVAREVCNVLLTDNDLRSLLRARDLSVLTMERITFNFKMIMGINSLLLALGIVGVLQPAAAALLHNSTTIAAAVNALRPLRLPDRQAPGETE